jgi:hypothetical protein
MVDHQPNLMERLCLKGGDFETGITGLSNRSLHASGLRIGADDYPVELVIWWR